MIKLRKLTLTLVALIAMTTGAWAQEESAPGTVIISDDKSTAEMTMSQYDVTLE